MDALGRAAIGATWNHYALEDPRLDRPGGAGTRCDTLARYLSARRQPALLLVGEAAGYRGCRFSGVPFTSERFLDGARWTSTAPRGFVEPSSTIVHGPLGELGVEARTLLWNAVPTHPHGGSPLSNRTPTRAELEEGAVWLERLLLLCRPAVIVAVGARSQAACALLAPPGSYCGAVRHPANGGARLFREQLRAVVSARVPAP